MVFTLEDDTSAFTPNTLDDHEASRGWLGIQWSSFFSRDRPPRLAESLVTLRNQVNQAAPARSTASDGWIGDRAHRRRRSDHNPHIRDGQYNVVSALDITNDPDNGCNCEVLADALITGKDPRIKYVIWNRRIFSSVVTPWTWRDYSGSNPHIKHIHISVLADKSKYDSSDEWTISLS